MKFISGYAMNADYSVKVCNFNDDSDCYMAKTVPIITEVSSSSGYKSGGQLLTIKGYGFQGSTSTLVKVDNVDCVIQTLSPEEITCMTGEQSNTPALATAQYGPPGLKRKFCQKENDASVSLSDLDPLDEINLICEDNIQTNFETLYNVDDYYG